MKGLPLVTALGLLTLSLAGCVNDSERESTSEPRARGFAVSVADLQRIRVDVVGNVSGAGLVAIEVEREDGTNLAERDIETRGGPMNATLDADVSGSTTVWVLVTLREGSAANAHVQAVGLAADGTQTPLRDEAFQL